MCLYLFSHNNRLTLDVFISKTLIIFVSVLVLTLPHISFLNKQYGFAGLVLYLKISFEDIGNAASNIMKGLGS